MAGLTLWGLASVGGGWRAAAPNPDLALAGGCLSPSPGPWGRGQMRKQPGPAQEGRKAVGWCRLTLV